MLKEGEKNNMKATITIEIEGNPEDINSITKNLQSFMKNQPGRYNIRPQGFTPAFDIKKRPSQWWR